MDKLVTAVTEVELIVNSRPLSYFSTEDVEEPITPLHFIAGRRLMSLPDGPYNRDIDDNDEITHSDLTKRMIHLNTVLEHFWKRWKKECLLKLRDSHHQAPGKGRRDVISIGDVVLVHDEDRPRGFWKLALVEDLITGSDGQVRGACIRTHSEGDRPNYLQRPVQLLYPLEVHISSVDVNDHAASGAIDGSSVSGMKQEGGSDSSEVEKSSVQPSTQVEGSRQSKRTAARNANEFIRIQAEDS